MNGLRTRMTSAGGTPAGCLFRRSQNRQLMRGGRA
jgi:hypothetical protein